MFHIGAGGWAYFKVPGMDSLTAYSKAFDFVEVNSTFYTTPSIEMVRSWRRRVPEDFMFSVRCHKDLTHKFLLSPRQENHEILNQSLLICRELRAEILQLQTPPSFSPDEKRKDIKDLLSSIDFGNIRLAWEIRGRMAHGTVDMMQDLGIIHYADISREMPAVESDILYTRLFGHGEDNLYQFDDTGLLQMIEHERKRERAGEDVVFPVTKSKLIEKQGWKVFDLTENEHVHARLLLDKLPKGNYSNMGEVIKVL